MSTRNGGLLLNSRSGLIIKNSVLLYKQLIHPMVDYTNLT
jgi:hypothetical protein